MNGPQWFAVGARALNVAGLKADAVAIVLPEVQSCWRFAVVHYETGVPLVFPMLVDALGWFSDPHGHPGRLVLIDPDDDEGPASAARNALCGGVMARSYSSGGPGSIRSDVTAYVHADPWGDIDMEGQFNATELRALLAVHEAAKRTAGG